MNDNILEIKDLIVDYETDDGVVHAVNGMNLTLERGKSLGLVGETGAGKTTTALSILRLIPDPPGVIRSGSITLDGKDVLSLPVKEMRKLRGSYVSMIFQDPMTSLNPSLTVGEQIAEVIRTHDKSISKKQSYERAAEMLKTVGIAEDRLHDYTHQFSGGMRQRVIIAIALACSPQLLIADEPTTALDVTIQAQILRLMKKLQQETGTAIMLITHDLGVIRQMSDDVIVMYCGQIVESGTVGQIFSHMSHPYTMGLLASIPTLRDDGGRLKAIEGMVPSLYDLPTGCRFHPRCPYATEQCRANCPELREVEPGHYTRCFRDSFGKE